MATFAPYSAKRTAMAWPMPDVPPVTRTFLPFRPRMPSVLAVGAVAVMRSSSGGWRSLRAGSESQRVGRRYRLSRTPQEREREQREDEHREEPAGDEGGTRRVPDDAELGADHHGRDDERERRRLQEAGHAGLQAGRAGSGTRAPARRGRRGSRPGRGGGAQWSSRSRRARRGRRAR